MFYGDGTGTPLNGLGMWWKTSLDGATWGAATQLGSEMGNKTAHITVYFDGVSFHYALSPMSYAPGNKVFYRKGTPNTDGTITWAAAEQLVTTIDNLPLTVSGIVTDSNGYPWIVWDSQIWAYVYGSTTKNGIWTNGPQKNLGAGSLVGWASFIVALSSGKLYAGTTEINSSTCRGYLYNGATWEAVETITTNYKIAAENYSGVSIADNTIYFSYSSQDNTGIKCAIRSPAGVWSQTTINALDLQTSLSLVGTLIYAFYFSITTDLVYYKKYDNGWGAENIWVDETVDQLFTLVDAGITSSSGLNVGLVGYVTKIVAPFSIKVAGLQIAPVGVSSTGSFSEGERKNVLLDDQIKTRLLEYPFCLISRGGGKGKGVLPPLKIPEPVRRHGN